VLDDPALFQPVSATRHRDDAVDPSALWFRTERQTVRALPASGSVLFTIRTTVAPLASADERQRRLLAATLRTVDPAMAAYKGWTALLPPLLAWLEPGSAPVHSAR
jgi:hypothetical protein